MEARAVGLVIEDFGLDAGFGSDEAGSRTGGSTLASVRLGVKWRSDPSPPAETIG